MVNSAAVNSRTEGHYVFCACGEFLGVTWKPLDECEWCKKPFRVRTKRSRPAAAAPRVPVGIQQPQNGRLCDSQLALARKLATGWWEEQWFYREMTETKKTEEEKTEEEKEGKRKKKGPTGLRLRLSPQEIAFVLEVPERAVWTQALHKDWTAQYRVSFDERKDERKIDDAGRLDIRSYWLARSKRAVQTLIYEGDEGVTPRLVLMGCGVPFTPQTTCEDIHPGWTFPPHSRLCCPVCHRHGCEDWRADRSGSIHAGDPHVAWGPMETDWRAKMVKPKPKDRPNEGWPQESGVGDHARTPNLPHCDKCGCYTGKQVKHLVQCRCGNAKKIDDWDKDYRLLLRFIKFKKGS